MAETPYKLIKATDPSLWREGLSQLLVEHTEKACQAVISVLSDVQWAKRDAAAKVLIEWGDEVLTSIVASLNGKKLDELYWLLQVVGTLGNDDCRSVIIPYLNNDIAEIRGYAIRALSLNKTLENAKPLYRMLSDKNWAVRKIAFEQLLNFGSLILNDLKMIIFSHDQTSNHSVIALYIKIGKDEILPNIISKYSEKNFDFRYSVVSALGELATPNAINFLVNTLSDPSWAIRNNTANQLIKIGNKTFEHLTAAFNVSNSIKKHQIISILVDLLGNKSMPLVKRLLDSNDHEYKLLAIENLAKLKSDEATKILLDTLSNSSRIISDFTASRLILKPNLNIQLLIDQLSTTDENLRFQIIKIVGSIGGLALSPIIKILKEGSKPERLFLLGVLGRIEASPQLVDVLIQLLGDKSWPVRNAASNCLVTYGDASVTAIVQALNSQSDDVRFWANKSLIMIGPRAVKVLTQILDHGNDSALMPHIVSALLSMNHADAVPAVMKFLENSDDIRIKSVFINIPEITSSEVVNTVLDILTHPEERVAKWLSHLLRKVNPKLRKTVLLGFSHSNQNVRFHISDAVMHWDNIAESELRVITRQLHVEKTFRSLANILRTVSKYPIPIILQEVRKYLENIEPKLMLESMSVISELMVPEYLDLLGDLLLKHSEDVTIEEVSIEDVDVVGNILGNIYRHSSEGLIKGLHSPSMVYRLCCVIALDSIDERKVAFGLMENILPNEDDIVLKRAVKAIAKYYFRDDFRLKGAITDFYLSLGKVITSPLIEIIEELENEIERKSLIDMIESVGGEVNTDILKFNKNKKVVLSDTHLDDVLEKRRKAMDEIEKYDELINTTHTKELAIMFTDVKGFTAFSAKASLSEVMSMMKQHDEILQPVFDKHAGTVLKKIGDAFLVVFENHNNSVLSAIDIQRQLREFNKDVPDDRKLAVRIAINSGSVIRTENDVMGDAVNLASRLEGIADAFEIVISEFTLKLISQESFQIEEFGTHNLKGISKPVKAYKIGW